ncbi:MAG: hypothetical protein JO356_07050 [Acidobacteria bacterium]|nr:hypothetical protein [Acidobacteriota bacterium]
MPRAIHPSLAGIDTRRVEKDPAEISPDTLERVLKWIGGLEDTDYQVFITNNSDNDLDDLTVSYFVNTLVGDQIQNSGPFSKSLQALPPGQEADFHLTTCLSMGTNYFISLNYQGTSYVFTENITQLNEEEFQQFGYVDFCDDWLEVFIQ